MPELLFDSTPKLSPWAALFPRKPGLAEGEELPRFSARLQGLVATDLGAYRSLCNFADDGCLPITHPQVAAAPLHVAIFTHREFPLPAMGLVHVSSEIIQHRPIADNEPMDLHCWVEGQRPARKGIEADLVTEVSVGGQEVWRSITTVLSTAGPGHGQKTESPPTPELDPESQAPWALPSDLGRRYSKVAGDRNPIHLYAWSAKLFGFKRHIIHGMWLLARAVAELGDDAPRSEVRLTASFKRPVFLPGQPVFRSGAQGGGRAFQVRHPQTDKLHLHGWIGPDSST